MVYKKNIVFVIPSLGAGGGEKSLVNLLSVLDYSKYNVDLIFKNNYNSSIIFIPKFNDDSIELSVYAKEKDFSTKLTPVNMSNIDSIVWKYEVFNKENNKVKEEYLTSKYSEIDDY